MKLQTSSSQQLECDIETPFGHHLSHQSHAVYVVSPAIWDLCIDVGLCVYRVILQNWRWPGLNTVLCSNPG